jgi:hypothetical protein
MAVLVTAIQANQTRKSPPKEARIHAKSAPLSQFPGVDTRDKRGHDGRC